MQKTTLTVFLSCMAITAALMLITVWTPLGQGPDTNGPPLIVRFAMTFFVVGLASFLTWITAMILEIRDSIKK